MSLFIGDGRIESTGSRASPSFSLVAPGKLPVARATDMDIGGVLVQREAEGIGPGRGGSDGSLGRGLAGELGGFPASSLEARGQELVENRAHGAVGLLGDLLDGGIDVGVDTETQRHRRLRHDAVLQKRVACFLT